ncbi:MAG: TIGR01777 family oxidoreductase [Ignavibacteria bacterium]|nr:TIGR01777 family oxidoreductase [Ignavibacteria bacterium]
MFTQKVLVTGATGLIGKKLVLELHKHNYSVAVTTRSIEKAAGVFGNSVEYIQWDSRKVISDIAALKAVTHVVNLAGAGIAARRWTPDYKNEILSSRVNSTHLLHESFRTAGSIPSVVVSSSAIGYYGENGDRVLTEASAKGIGFLSDVCSQWENAALTFQADGTHCTCIRTGVVLSPEGGALQKMLMPFKFGLGGPLGSGNQWFSWIHINDMVQIIIRALSGNLPTIINATAPNPVQMKHFTQTLGAVLHRPAVLPVPSLALKLILGEAAIDILSSQRVIPEQLLNSEFQFGFALLQDALHDLLQ